MQDSYGALDFLPYDKLIIVIKAELGEKKRENSTGNKTFYHKIAKETKATAGQIRFFDVDENVHPTRDKGVLWALLKATRPFSHHACSPFIMPFPIPHPYS
ncbi:hypothetical protein NC653_019211 [Populus alba x Populus x berolinensis]|uniref:Uncharacterized protein n=1 Tax=Populus alba x Populus x berolinensis TaxID=444605 RepID=A0AAD6QI98_9ROSI|nr:hypothetical protein NC653_019211 [Populus alba x Populus x berolinensis]